MSNIPLHWISSNAALAEHCARWQSLPFVALDTEFVRVNTFYPKVGLIQAGDGKQAFLIDPCAIDDWQPLCALLETPSVVKVLHSCSEDLEIFARTCGALPAPLFDSQLAAAYLNLGTSLGYSALVQSVLGVTLPKGETRSDWCQRPLSAAQSCYAAEDVLHLAQLYQKLRERLPAQKMDWLLQDGAELVAAAQRAPVPENAWQSVKLAWKLSAGQLAVLRALCLWREQTARDRDRPKGWILPEAALWPLSRWQPSSLAQLARIEGMDARTVRQDGNTLLALIREAATLSPQDCPKPPPLPLPASSAGALQALREAVQQQAQQLDIPAEVLLRKKVLQDLLQSGFPDGPYQLPPTLRGWRRALLGEKLLAVLHSPSA